ncbi:MAG TPA: NAD-dependent succinate-semialdehyde dehydrogenase [Chitinophagales bacterium]|nr:NAD-dependent succinate-semialdehyde dehydrogenase [Chitinophagales bacterium]
MKSFKSINPFDQSVVGEHKLMNESELKAALQNAETVFASWKKTSFEHRSDLLNSLASILRERKDEFATTMALEMGKILKEGKTEIEKCAATCVYYAEHGEAFMRDEMISTEGKKSFVDFQPTGAVFGIMPWNFPFWQVIRAAAPTIMAGNVFLLKHAPNVSRCSKEIEKVFREAGFPQHVFQSLIIDIDQTEKIISSDAVQGVTLTGSELAGSSVASLAGKHIKKTVLELGGSDPLIVLEDADLEKASKVALQSRMQNAGQSCIASKRFIVLEKVKDDFIQKLIDGAKKLKQGNQLDESTTMAPMARVDLAEKLEAQEKSSLKNGTEILIGGNRNGCNYQPTLLNNVKPGVPAFDEEMFGPVAAIITAKDEDEAIQLANKNRYGLGASIWTKDLDRGERIAKMINSGSVFINSLVRSDARLPFGGIKKSGYGRELSKYGMHEFTNIKTIFIE